MSRRREEVGMLDHLVMAGLVLVFALVLAWMLLTVATGVTLNGLL